MADRLELAHLWQSVLKTDPNRLFGRDAENLMQESDSGDDLPQPGFVGPSYRAGGVLFLGNYPGNATKDLSVLERQHVRCLRDLKDATPVRVQGSFEALMASLVPAMSEWGLVQKYVRPILPGSDMDLDSIAYINLFKWRSRREPPAHMYHRSWREHTGKQYRLLRPKFVVALGNGTFDRFKALSSARDTTGVGLFKLKRSRGDQQPPPAATLQLMPEIAEEIRQHYNS